MTPDSFPIFDRFFEIFAVILTRINLSISIICKTQSMKPEKQINENELDMPTNDK